MLTIAGGIIFGVAGLAAIFLLLARRYEALSFLVKHSYLVFLPAAFAVGIATHFHLLLMLASLTPLYFLYLAAVTWTERKKLRQNY